MSIPIQTWQMFKFFSSLPECTIAKIAHTFKIKNHPAGQVILKKGERSDSLLFLLSGQVDIIDFDAEGGETWITTIYPGQHFGELALILNEPRSADAVATRPSKVASLPGQEALKLMTEHPQIAKNMMEHLAQTIKNQNAHLHMLNQPNAKERVKALLKMKTQRYKSGLVTIENLPSQAQLAKMANTSRETVSRILAQMARNGVIEKDYKRLIIRKPEALEPGEKEN